MLRNIMFLHTNIASKVHSQAQQSTPHMEAEKVIKFIRNIKRIDRPRFRASPNDFNQLYEVPHHKEGGFNYPRSHSRYPRSPGLYIGYMAITFPATSQLKPQPRPARFKHPRSPSRYPRRPGLYMSTAFFTLHGPGQTNLDQFHVKMATKNLQK